MSNLPTIRASSQARLLLYRLLSKKLVDACQSLLNADPLSWDQVFSRLEQALGENAEIKSDRIILSQVFSTIDQTTKNGLQNQIARLTGQSLWLGVHPTGLLDSFIAEHLRLINSVQREHMEKIGLSLQRGIREGRLARDMAKDIKQHTAISKRRSLLIARNAPLQYSGALTRHYQTTVGIKSYRWATSQDERVRESHRKLNGQIRSWEDAGLHPRSEVNCRCDAIPILP